MLELVTKKCSGCGNEFELSVKCFFRSKHSEDGYARRCKMCFKVPAGTVGKDAGKECALCGEFKSLFEFDQADSGRLGLHSRCKVCIGTDGREYKGKREPGPGRASRQHSVGTLLERGDYDVVMERRSKGVRSIALYKARKRAAGLCIRCGKNPTGGKLICDDCRQKNSLREAKKRKERRNYRRANRLCDICESPLSVDDSPKRHLCILCRGKAAIKRTGKMQRRRRRTKPLILEMYGKVCACCGVTDERFLSVDHVNNDGAQERKGRRSNNRKLLQFKRPDIQILCYNCNFAKEVYGGTCPHKILARGDNWNMLKTA
jgi:hypothetical protein